MFDFGVLPAHVPRRFDAILHLHSSHATLALEHPHPQRHAHPHLVAVSQGTTFPLPDLPFLSPPLFFSSPTSTSVLSVLCPLISTLMLKDLLDTALPELGFLETVDIFIFRVSAARHALPALARRRALHNVSSRELLSLSHEC